MKKETTNPTKGVHISVRGKKNRKSNIYLYYQKFTKLLTHAFPGLGETRVRQVWIDGRVEIRTPKATLIVDADGSITFGDVLAYEGECTTIV